MDKRASMGAIGDVDKYMQFQAADALRDAAQNEGGGAGLGAGLGAGFAVGGQMANAFGSGRQPAESGRRTGGHRCLAQLRKAERSRRKILLPTAAARWRSRRCRA